MRLIKCKKPNGGFEITIKAAVFLFEIELRRVC